MAKSARMSRDALKRALHEIDGARLDRILALDPTPADVQEAVQWLAGNAQSFLGRDRLPAARTIEIVNIVVGDDERVSADLAACPRRRRRVPIARTSGGSR